MAKHWSADMFVLCWSDMRSNGRMRMSWHSSRERLERMAAAMPEDADPVLYDGLSQRLTLRCVADDAPVKAKKKRAKKAKAPVDPPVAA